MNGKVVRAGILILALTVCASANAAQRTFVSAGTGTDSNPCTRDLPCRNFSAALAATSSGGELIVLDSGGYGAVTISSPVSVISPAGVYAGISSFTVPAVSVTVPTTAQVVTLRGLFLNAQGGTIGIDFTSGGALQVENCAISGFPNRGINLDRSTASDLAEVYISDTVIRNGGFNAITNDAAVFLKSSGSGSAVRAIIEGLRVERYYVGLWSVDRSYTAIGHSNFSGNDYGVVASATTGTTALVDIHDCILANNFINGTKVGDGNFAGGTATMTISNSLISHAGAVGVRASPNGTCFVSFNTIANNAKGVGVDMAGGAMVTGGSNRLFNNTTDGVFTATIAQQ